MGEITAVGCNYVGGIAGCYGAAGSVTVEKVTNEADITGADYTGGIFGAVNNQTDSRTDYVFTFAEATNKGEITGANYVGGIVGHLRVNNNNWSTTLKASVFINEGDVSGTGNVGGLMAYCYTDNSGSRLIGYTSTGDVSGAATSKTIYEPINVTLQE